MSYDCDMNKTILTFLILIVLVITPMCINAEVGETNSYIINKCLIWYVANDGHVGIFDFNTKNLKIVRLFGVEMVESTSDQSYKFIQSKLMGKYRK